MACPSSPASSCSCTRARASLKSGPASPPPRKKCSGSLSTLCARKAPKNGSRHSRATEGSYPGLDVQPCINTCEGPAIRRDSAAPFSLGMLAATLRNHVCHAKTLVRRSHPCSVVHFVCPNQSFQLGEPERPACGPEYSSRRSHLA